jgi:iron-sulfur cluster assembly accessory protein
MTVLRKSKYSHQEVDYIKVSEAAANNILNSLTEHQKELEKSTNESDLCNKLCGIKLAIPSKGCGGLAYEIEFAYIDLNVNEEDEVITLPNGAQIFIDPQKSFMLIGLTLDYEDNGIEYGFTFNNPNESGKCGCGSSFFVDGNQPSTSKKCQ